ncbi:MAG TPA: DUF438 domain-containing protein [Bacillota bacterium]|nr:DUF438 domain-containing protein [Bacillota bacterium]
MLEMQFDIKRINLLKKILLRLRNEEPESVQVNIEHFFKDASVVDILLIEQELINGDYGITIEDVMKLSSIYPHLYSEALNEADISETHHPSHPVQMFKEENTAFQFLLHQINLLFEAFEKNPQHVQETEMIEELQQLIVQLGEFHKHYHRKEKLFFPIMEEYGHYAPTRIMWRGDDRMRALYQAVKRQIDQQDINVEHIRKTYDTFEKGFKEMIFQEEAIILPVLLSIFHESDWLRIAKESAAFGYAIIEPDEEWISKSQKETFVEDENQAINNTENVAPTHENIAFGGGYLTTEEANLILNNLPLEITFVDKNSVFKYFNEITEASEMMLVRTPISIGRNVANCHPPKSLKKVMTLVRDLKTKKRSSESMWFKKKDQYIHLTYKALFNDEEEFLGILEYVQDIQPFFDLPSDIKTGLTRLGQ